MRPLLTLLTLALLAPLAQANEPPSQLRAHQHGQAELNLAVEGQRVFVELITPAANLLGFEHAPRTPTERTHLEQRLDLIQQGPQLIRFPQAAQCRQELAEIESPLLNAVTRQSQAPEPDHHAPGEKTAETAAHSEFHIRFAFHCEQPTALTHAELLLWEHFAAFERVHARLITATGQRSVQLSSDRRQLPLQGAP